MPAFQELTARLTEIESDIRFVNFAVTLRPRLGGVVRWDAAGDLADLARQFISEKTIRPESLYGALFVRVMAAFERYMRQLVQAVVGGVAAKAKSYDDIAEKIGARNMLLTGRILSSSDSPRDHLSFNYQELIDNLASCRAGSTTFKLNGDAFSALVTSGSPAVVERALRSVEVDNWWDAIGRDTRLRELLQTKKARETAQRTEERLKELWRWRNQIAHAGDGEIVLSAEQVQDSVDFVLAFAKALDTEVLSRLSKA